ncbi:hypothetical protein KBC79_01485 [Candidatus Woesebacteria bacterium]|nr:hypothetical protein [Candidatus Woesebacteria bacterium]
MQENDPLGYELLAIISFGIFIFLWAFAVPWSLKSAVPVGEYKVPTAVHNTCVEAAEKMHESFIGTKFEDYNFYYGCVLNIECVTTVKECPIEEIHKQSEFMDKHYRNDK